MITGEHLRDVTITAGYFDTKISSDSLECRRTRCQLSGIRDVIVIFQTDELSSLLTLCNLISWT